jgi:hypothetical protein
LYNASRFRNPDILVANDFPDKCVLPGQVSDEWDKKKGSVESTPDIFAGESKSNFQSPPLLLILDSYVTLFANWSRARKGDSPEVRFVFYKYASLK